MGMDGGKLVIGTDGIKGLTLNGVDVGIIDNGLMLSGGVKGGGEGKGGSGLGSRLTWIDRKDTTKFVVRGSPYGRGEA